MTEGLKDRIIELAEYVDVASVVSDSVLRLLCNVSELKTFDTRTEILKKGDKPSFWGVAVKGFLRTYYVADDAREITDGIYGHNYDLFIPSVDEVQNGMSFNVVVTDNSELLCFDIDGFMSLASKHADIAMFFAFCLQKRLLVKTQLSNIFKSKNTTDAYCLLIDNLPDVFNKLPSRVLASYLGMTAETFCRLKTKIKPLNNF